MNAKLEEELKRLADMWWATSGPDSPIRARAYDDCLEILKIADEEVAKIKQSTEERISKKMSYALRHHPESIGAKLDKQGWMDITTLLRGINITRHQLDEVVANNNKKRFIIEGDRIRANQGHSVKIDLGYEPSTPPARLYHGTIAKVLEPIRKEGLTKRERHHVHLSADVVTANQVGQRRGRPIILVIDAAKMAKDNYKFFITPNGVWLTDHVPPKYLLKETL